MKSTYRNTLYLAFALLLACAALQWYRPASQNFPVKLGLDLSGGTRAVLEMQEGPGTPPLTTDVQQQVVQVIERRVNALGVAEPLVQAKGDRQIVVEMPQTPGKSLEQSRKDLSDLISPARLEFIWLRDVESDANPTGRFRYESGNRFVDKDTNRPLTEKEVRERILYAAPKNVIVTGADLKPGGALVSIGQDTGGVETQLQFGPEGTRKFSEFTSQHVGALLAIVLNGRIDSAPHINEPITGGTAVITQQGATVAEAQQLANLLNAGALPVPLVEVSSSSVEATLGRDAVRDATVGGSIGIAFVLLFMIAYYALPGAVACVALVMYAIFTYAAFRLIGVTLTLPGIAGFILSIGMAVDANILIFERMKEELKAGRTLHAAMEAGFDRAWTSIRDSNFSTLITCAILYAFGTGPVRGFAVVLALGVLVSIFTAITVSRALLHVVASQPWGQKLSLYRVGFQWGPRLEGRSWDVMGRWRVWLGISTALVLTGFVFMGLNAGRTGSWTRLGIDFTGGSYLTYALPPGTRASDTDIQKVFSDNGFPATVQRGVERTEGAASGTAGRATASVRTREVDEASRTRLLTAMQARFGAQTSQAAFDRVGPTISRELTRNAFFSVVGACALIMLYLAFVFGQFGFVDGLRYGACAVLALVHDVVVVMGFMAMMAYLLGWELNSLFVTAALTVIGFSVHDSIVVFDRIRENLKIRGRETSFREIANDSISQTLSRSINTSLGAIITLITLVAFGTGGSLDLKVFASVMIVGLISGSYSSIFNATPILMLFERAEENKRQRAPAAPVAASTPSAPATEPTATPPTRATPPTPGGTDTSDGAASPPRPAPKKTRRRF